MRKRKLKDKLISKNDIKEELRLIDESNKYYITKTGKVYSDYGNDLFYPIKTHINKNNGYLYTVIIDKKGEKKTRRVHRLVAIAYIPNPNNLPDVMHKDNNKANPNVENLKWGTASENTKQAFDDGLAVNAKGFEDSQSCPVTMYDTLTNEKICDYGSLREAAKNCDNITLRGITHQIYDHSDRFLKPFYFTLYNNPPTDHYIVIERKFETDEEIGRYINTEDAHQKTGVSQDTINRQCINGYKPKRLSSRNKRKSYFSWELIGKGEQP